MSFLKLSNNNDRLQGAVEENDYDAVNELLKNGADPFYEDDNHQNSFDINSTQLQESSVNMEHGDKNLLNINYGSDMIYKKRGSAFNLEEQRLINQNSKAYKIYVLLNSYARKIKNNNS